MTNGSLFIAVDALTLHYVNSSPSNCASAHKPCKFWTHFATPRRAGNTHATSATITSLSGRSFVSLWDTPGALRQTMAFDQIQHVFVLMLENRSFDHLLGFSGISGTDAVSGLQTTVTGLSGTESNASNGTVGTVSHPADYA